MIDIDALKEILERGDHTCVLSDGDKLVTSRERGVKPLVGFIDGGTDFRGFAAADKVVGKGAALLYVCMGIARLYAGVISVCALDVCRRYGIEVEYGMLVQNIIDRKGDGICPMEKLTASIDDPKTALDAIREKLKSM